MRRISTVVLLCVLLVICGNGVVTASQTAAGDVLETAAGPGGLLELERQGQVTVRAIRAWGRLPDRFVQLGQELRRDSRFDLLTADPGLLKEWIALADNGNPELSAVRDGLADLLGFMERGDYLDWQSIRDLAVVEPGLPLRQGGKRWLHELVPAGSSTVAKSPGLGGSGKVVLFAGQMAQEWLPYQADGGKFAEFAKSDNGLMNINVPAGNSWGRTGIRSNTAMVEHPRGRQAGVRLTALFDPQGTSDAIISLVPSTAKTNDEWYYHHVRVGMHLEKESGVMTLTLWIARKVIMTREIAAPLERFDLILRPDDVVLVTDDQGKTLLQGVLPDEHITEGYSLYALTGSTAGRRSKPLRMALRSIERIPEPFTLQYAPDSLPDETQRITLFANGVLGHLWVPTAGRSSDFTRDASLDGGELVVDVEAGGQWGKVGVYSPGALVWLDHFEQGAEVAVTFEFDPARTTGFVVALSPLYNLVGNDPSKPHVWAQWNVTEDGSGGRGMLVIKPDFPKTAWEGETSATAPDTVTLRLSRDGVLVEGLGTPQERFPWQSAMPNMGFRVYAISHAAKAALPVRMALRRIQLDRQAGVEQPVAKKPVEGVKPLEITTLFAGQSGEMWEPYAVRGGSFEEHGRFENSRLVVELPDGKHSWRKVGIVSQKPVFAFNERILRTSYAVRLKCDSATTTGVQAVFRSSKSADMEKGGDVLASFVRHDTGRYAGRYVLSLSGENTVYRNWQRTVDAAWVEQHWDGELEILFGNGWVELGIAGGPRLRGMDLRTGKGWSYHMSATTLSATPLGAARLTLENITGQWVAPDGMTAGERWQLVDDEDFDAGAFLDELAGELPPQ